MNGPVRRSGVQLHITSLPGGRLGRDAYQFVDWLAAAGQTWWQVLPLGPPDRYRSPYKSRSAFAAWPGLLASPRAPVTRAEIIDFRDRQRFWVDDWERFSGGGAIADQVRFDREWGALRRYAAERGIRIMGDVAIYVSPGSADHRAHPWMFQDGLVAGAPPDAYARERAAVGEPAVSLAGPAAAGIPMVGRARASHAGAVRPGADRPLPRLRRLLGGAGRRPRRHRRLVAGGGPGGALFAPLRAALGAGCRWWPRTSA